MPPGSWRKTSKSATAIPSENSLTAFSTRHSRWGSSAWCSPRSREASEGASTPCASYWTPSAGPTARSAASSSPMPWPIRSYSKRAAARSPERLFAVHPPQRISSSPSPRIPTPPARTIFLYIRSPAGASPSPAASSSSFWEGWHAGRSYPREPIQARRFRSSWSISLISASRRAGRSLPWVCTPVQPWMSGWKAPEPGSSEKRAGEANTTGGFQRRCMWPPRR